MNVFDTKSVLLNNELGRTDKERMLQYIKLGNILEIGCGSGVNLDMIEKHYSNSHIYGMDISSNVISTLELRRQIESRSWSVIQGNAIDVRDCFPTTKFDTIIFCSVLHEVFSYTSYNGTKFNYDTIKAALQEAFMLLKPGGRIIIRDGIMSEPKDANRFIWFKDKYGISFFKQYINDFKGRQIKYEQYDLEGVVKLNINDAMEFLYTYTWGYEPYEYEVQEQYGYFTLTEYYEFLFATLKDINILRSESYVQEGYKKSLEYKISLTDEEFRPVELPDSNCFIVIEKTK